VPAFLGTYLLAGLLVGAGAALVAGGGQVWEQARWQAGAEQRLADMEQLATLLRAECDLAELRRQAAAAGVDPDVVEAGYTAMRAGDVTVDDLLREISRH
jgi:hypothetical protein